MLGPFGRANWGALRGARRGPGPRRFRPCLEALEDRQLLSASSLVYPGPDGHLVYTPDAQGNTIPDFSNVGYLAVIAVPAAVRVFGHRRG